MDKGKRRKKSGKGAAAAAPRAARTPGREAEGGGQLLDMDQAAAMLKTSRATFYRLVRAGKIKAMKVGRQWRFYRQDVDGFLAGAEPRVDLPADITPLVEELESNLKKLGAAVPPRGERKVAHAVDLMIQLGVAMGASDLHFEPQAEEVRLRCRHDGLLRPVCTYDPRVHPAIISQWKALAACDVHETKRPQDGFCSLDLPSGGRADLRLCFVPAQTGETLTVRLLPQRVELTIDQLFTGRERERLLKWLGAPWGAIVIAGPTGSGKMTTAYAALKHLTGPNRKVMTVEDPVRIVIPGVTQVQVDERAGRTFAAVGRSFFRSDPDVMLIGETRSNEVLNLVCQAALTGHLVLTTLHTDDAPSTLQRMVDIGVPPFVILSAVKLIVAQRLALKLCPACSRPAQPDANLLSGAEELARAGGLDWPALPKNWRQPIGCDKCRFSGFSGRTLLPELLEVTPEIGAALRRGASIQDMRAIAVSQGMVTMGAQGVRRAAAGETVLEEAMCRVPPV